MKSLELIRDKKGRPVAIRVRFEGVDLRSRVRAIAGSVTRWIPAMPSRVVQPFRAAGSFLRDAIPELELRRDDVGRPGAIVMRFGARAMEADTPVPREAISARFLRSMKSLAVAAAPVMPRLTLVRDGGGRAAAIRLWVGAPDVEAMPSLEESPISRADKWVVEPRRMGVFARVEELWRYRRVLWFLATRSSKRLYQKTTLGVFWLFARPLAPLFISTLIFGRLLNVPSDGLPYFLFFLAGSASWNLFERSLMWATRSLDQNKGVLKKVYFPRLIVPIASVSPALMDFLIFMALLAVSFVYYRFKDGVWYFAFGPGNIAALFALVLSVFFAIAVGLWTSVLNARHRDVRYTLRYVTRFWSYATPVFYAMSQVPEKYKWLVYANPMAPIVETFKWGLLGVGTFPALPLLSAIGVTLLTFAGGFWYFGRAEAVSIDKM